MRNKLLAAALLLTASTGFVASVSAQPQAEVALLDSVNTKNFMDYWYQPACATPTYYLDEEYKRYLLGWEWVLMNEGISYQIVHDEDITLDGLAGFKVLVLPNTALLSDEQTRAIHQWVIRGGRLLATFGSGYKDLAADPRQEDGWKKQKGGTFGLHQLWHDPVSKAFSTYWIDSGVDIKITRYEGPTDGLKNLQVLPLKNDVLPYGAEANILVNRPANYPGVLAFLIIDNPDWKANSPAIISTRQAKGLVVYFAFAPEYLVYKELEASENLPQGWPRCDDGQTWKGRGQQVWPLMADTIRYLQSN